MQTHKKNALNHNSKSCLPNMQEKLYTRVLFTIALCFSLFQAGCSAKAPAPQVLLESKLFIRNEILVGSIIGGVRNIQKSDFSDLEGDEIAVIGQSSYLLLSSEDYKVLEHKKYLDVSKKPIYLGLSPQLLDINNDYNLEIMSGGGGFGKVGLRDSYGTRRWNSWKNLSYHLEK